MFKPTEPCTNGGQYLDQATGCQLCDADTWGSPGSTSATCTPCPTDKGVAAGAGSSEGDCTWSKLVLKFQYIFYDDNEFVEDRG